MATGDLSYDNMCIKDVAIYGHELTKELAGLLGRPGSEGVCRSLVQAVLVAWENLMSSAVPVETDGELHMAGDDPRVEVNLSRSPSPKKRPCKDQEDRQELSKKRKNLPTWTRQVKVPPGTGLEGAIEDGFTWRKYGQKAILRSTHPRGYYRCTHRFTQGCQAKKKVQRSEENPSMFDVNYEGYHTCTQRGHLQSKPPSVAAAAAANGNPQCLPNPLNPHTNSLLLQNFKENLRVETENLENTNPEFFSTRSVLSESGLIYTPSPLLDASMRRSFSPFVSPAPSESNYFTSSPFPSDNMEDFLYGAEDEFTEIISNLASSSSSPTPEQDFAAEEEAALEESDIDLAAYFNWN